MPAKRSCTPKPDSKSSKTVRTVKRKRPSSKKDSVQKKTSNSKCKRPAGEVSFSKRGKVLESGQFVKRSTSKKKVEKLVTSSNKRKVAELNVETTRKAKKAINLAKNRKVKRQGSTKSKKVKSSEKSEMTAIEIIKPALRTFGLKPRMVVSGDLKIMSYNVNGIRAATKKGLVDFLIKEDADIVCFSETKCEEDKNPLTELNGYQTYWYDCSFKKGYSGTCVLSKIPALNVQKGHGVFDDQGRVITLEYPSFYLCHCYVPNSGEGKHIPHKGKKLKFEDRRKAWDIQMRKHLEALKSKKPLIWTGDLNVAIQDFDVFDGETNKNRARGAGFTPYERSNFGSLVTDIELYDVYREFYPNEREAHYTFWSMRSRARPVNKGWRLDYFMVTKDVLDAVKTIEVRKKFEDKELVLSDHVPLIMCLDPNSL